MRPASVLILAACGFLLPPLAVLAPLGLAPLLAAVALALLAVERRRAIAIPSTGLTPLALLFAALSLWAILSASWSILPQHSFLEGLRLVAIFAGGLIALDVAMALGPEARRSVAATAAIGAALAIAMLLVARMIDPTPTRYDRGTTTLVLALWPAIAAGATRWRRATLVLALAGAVTPLVMASTAAALALVLSIAVFAVAWFAPRLVALALASGIVLVAILLPLATPDDRSVVAIHQHAPWLKFTAIHRLLIWRFTADRIAERPLLGWGMDASRELPGGHLDFHAVLPDAGVMVGSEALPLHPHNAALQWEVELGVPGTLLALGIVIWGFWRVGFTPGLPRLWRAGALAWASAALVIALLSYGVWQAWWLSCLLLTAALYTSAVERDEISSA
jgi:exopolysaccharide production protein ExoQ